MGTMEATTLILKLAFTVCVIGALLWFVVRPVITLWRQQPNPEDLMPKLAELPGEELQIPVDPADRPKPTREEIIKQARSDPRVAAMVMKKWIGEKREKRGSR
jgi:flagellar biosynthesis/type III secretory pathway M-ring protein FliF/YscJ